MSKWICNNYVATCLTCSTSYSVVGPALSAWIFYYDVSRLANFSPMVVEITQASSNQGPNLALRIAAFRCTTSACSFSSFASCSLVNLYVMMTVHAVNLASSYSCCNSLASAFKLCRLGSSCRLMSTSIDCSKSIVHSATIK